VSKRIVFISLFILALGLRNFGQVVQAPFILCVNDSSSNGDVIINWALPPANPCGAFVQYTIYASSTGKNGPYNNVTAVTNQAATSFVLAGYNSPPQTWYFYMKDSVNCPGPTLLCSDTVNNQSPAVPIIVSVTVTPNNQSVISFLPDTSEQTSHYILYYYLPNGNAKPWDTVYGRNNTVVIDTSTNPQYNPSQFSQVFTVAAVDSCGNRSSYSILPQNTILATAANTECQRQVNISWNSYNNWPSGVAQYQVWVSKNGGPFTEDGFVGDTALNYAYSTFNTGDSLQIYIAAVSAADTNIVSHSNIIHMRAVIVQPPAYIFITNATVNAGNQIDITWTVDTIAQLIFYKLLQSVDSVDYSPTEQITTPSPLLHFQTYLDSDYVFPQNNPYYFKIDAYDSCENQYPTPFVKTVCLIGGLYDYYVTKLTWNDFLLSNATVMRYNLYRDIGSGFQLIQTFQPGVNEYFDSLQHLPNFLNDNGTFCYRIEAVYFINLPNPSGYQDTLISASNQVCIVHRPVIYVPNAFSPGGGSNTPTANLTFKPTIIYGAPAGYSMLIFNRWGGKIFESNNPDIGWDGTDHGKEAEMGGYAYLIDFTAADGTLIERKGIVLLVR